MRVVSSANVLRVAIGTEATSGELVDEDQLEKDMSHLMQINARRLSERKTAEAEASRIQQQYEEQKLETTMRESACWIRRNHGINNHVC